jgi:hypothetical protein
LIKNLPALRAPPLSSCIFDLVSVHRFDSGSGPDEIIHGASSYCEVREIPHVFVTHFLHIKSNNQHSEVIARIGKPGCNGTACQGWLNVSMDFRPDS